MKLTAPFLYAILLCGCAGGPTHQYYSPVMFGAKFKGPITMALVDDVRAEKERLVSQGYVVTGTSDYVGKYPEAVELKAQARRSGANHVIYSSKPTGDGGWRFSFSRFGGGGGSNQAAEVHIVFLGR